jgi:hypothetical protein
VRSHAVTVGAETCQGGTREPRRGRSFCHPNVLPKPHEARQLLDEQPGLSGYVWGYIADDRGFSVDELAAGPGLSMGSSPPPATVSRLAEVSGA